MTTEDECYHEFMDRCVNADNEPWATRIDDAVGRRREGRRARGLSEYHVGMARDNLEASDPLMALRDG